MESPVRRTGAWVAGIVLILASIGAAPGPADRDVGPLVRALRLVQRHGTPEALDPRNDQQVKGTLARALAKGQVLTADGIGGLIAPSTFATLAGSDRKLDRKEV